MNNSKIIKDAVERGELYIAKCHLSHQTGRVHLLNEIMDELEIEEI